MRKTQTLISYLCPNHQDGQLLHQTLRILNTSLSSLDPSDEATLHHLVLRKTSDLYPKDLDRLTRMQELLLKLQRVTLLITNPRSLTCQKSLPPSFVC